ncbi:hypothetical protein ACFL5Q_06260 [Planctomycetota bacterium]
MVIAFRSVCVAIPLMFATFQVQSAQPQDDAAAIDRFSAADLSQKLDLLKQWSREQAIPVLAHHASTADPKFVGVVNTGRLIQQTDLSQPFSVEKLTFENPHYWRGVMEMTPGNHLVVAFAILLFTADGELDKAAVLDNATRAFRDREEKRTLATTILAARQQRFELFNRQLNEEISQGIQLHDQGNYDRAIAVYDRVLTAYPGSAWARYERFLSRFHSEIAKAGPEAKADVRLSGPRWKSSAREIYRCNPLYSSQFHAERGRTMGALMARLRLREIEHQPPADAGVLFGSYAGAALQLEGYGYAAHIYWCLMTGAVDARVATGKGDAPRALTREELLIRFLYCLEKLGAPQWKRSFKGDFAAEFEKLDRELAVFRTQ